MGKRVVNPNRLGGTSIYAEVQRSYKEGGFAREKKKRGYHWWVQKQNGDTDNNLTIFDS